MSHTLKQKIQGYITTTTNLLGKCQALAKEHFGACLTAANSSMAEETKTVEINRIDYTASELQELIGNLQKRISILKDIIELKAISPSDLEWLTSCENYKFNETIYNYLNARETPAQKPYPQSLAKSTYEDKYYEACKPSK